MTHNDVEWATSSGIRATADGVFGLSLVAVDDETESNLLLATSRSTEMVTHLSTRQAIWMAVYDNMQMCREKLQELRLR